jgi:hypothetical protein
MLYKFKVTFLATGKVLEPKGFYYQGKKHVVLVGDVKTDSTVRQKVLVSEVKIEIL